MELQLMITSTVLIITLVVWSIKCQKIVKNATQHNILKCFFFHSKPENIEFTVTEKWGKTECLDIYKAGI